MFTALEKFMRGQNKTIKTLIGEVSTLYHLSPVPDIDQLKPLSGKYSKDTDQQDRSKISLADTLHGCVQALFIPGHPAKFQHAKESNMSHIAKAKIGPRQWRLWVYAVQTIQLNDIYLANYELDDSDNVFDQYLTGEVGYRRTLACTNLGSIIVNKLTKNEHESTVKPPYVVYMLPAMDDRFDLYTLLDFTLQEDKEQTTNLPPTLVQDFLDKDRELYELRIKRALEHSIHMLQDNVDRLAHYYRTGIWQPSKFRVVSNA